MSFSKPKQNLALPHAIQERLDLMLAGETGLSGPEMVRFFSTLDRGIEISERSPMLADRLSATTLNGLKNAVDQIVRVIKSQA